LFSYKAPLDLVNKQSKTPLDIAKSMQLVDIVDLFDNWKAQGHLWSENALQGDLELLERFYNNGYSIHSKDDEGRTWIHRACLYGDTKTVLYLLSKNVHLEETSNDGTTVLHYACFSKNIHIVALILQYTSELNLVRAADNDKMTALHYVAGTSDVSIASALIQNGADIEAKDKRQNTPLILASKRGQLKMIEFLVNAGAMVNAINQDNENALHAAGFLGYIDIMEYLVARGCNVNQNGADHQTPLEILKEYHNDNPQVQKLLHQIENPTKQDNEAVDMTCKICMQNQINCVLLTCGHLVVCKDCSLGVVQTSNQCPVCRAPIKSIAPIFLS
jgi:ankyrin repeat protein